MLLSLHDKQYLGGYSVDGIDDIIIMRVFRCKCIICSRLYGAGTCEVVGQGYLVAGYGNLCGSFCYGCLRSILDIGILGLVYTGLGEGHLSLAYRLACKGKKDLVRAAGLIGAVAAYGKKAIFLLDRGICVDTGVGKLVCIIADGKGIRVVSGLLLALHLDGGRDRLADGCAAALGKGNRIIAYRLVIGGYLQFNLGKQAEVCHRRVGRRIHRFAACIGHTTMFSCGFPESSGLETAGNSIGTFGPISGNRYSDLMKIGIGSKGIIAKVTSIASSELSAVLPLVIDAAVGIVNTGQLVNGVVKVAKLNGQLRSGLYLAFRGYRIAFCVGNGIACLLCPYNLIGCISVLLHLDDMASGGKSGNGYLSGLGIYCDSIGSKACIGKLAAGQGSSCH